MLAVCGRECPTDRAARGCSSCRAGPRARIRPAHVPAADPADPNQPALHQPQARGDRARAAGPARRGPRCFRRRHPWHPRRRALAPAGRSSRACSGSPAAACCSERHALDDSLTALEIEYDLQADLAGPISPTHQNGDLSCGSPGAHTALVVAGPWDGRLGLLDLASAIARAFTEDPPRTRSVALSWRLVDRAERGRVLFQRSAPERTGPAPAKRPRGEDSD